MKRLIIDAVTNPELAMRLYHNRAECSKVRAALEWLASRGVTPELVDVREARLAREDWAALVAATGQPARLLLRDGEPQLAALGLDAADVDDDTVIDALTVHPNLMQRPLVEHRGRVLLARPTEGLAMLLD